MQLPSHRLIRSPLVLGLAALFVSCSVGVAQITRCELLPSSSGDLSPAFALVKLAPLPQDEQVSFAAYLLPKNEQPAEKFRIQSVYPWFSGDTCLLHVRGWPQGVSGPVDLVLKVTRGGEVTSFRMENATTITERRMTVALLVDDSYSMRRTDPTKLRVTAAKTFGEIAASLEEVSSMSLISFARNANVLMQPTSPKEAATLEKALNGLKAESRTDMDEAFSLAVKVLETRNESRKVVVVLSDGRNEPGRYRETHRLFASRGWPVYTIGLSDEADVETLKRIAADTKGKFFFAPTADELAGIFREIAFSIHKTVNVADWQGAPGQTRIVPVDDSIGLLSVTMNSGTALSIRSADGRTFDSAAEVRSPAPGDWTLVNTAAGNASVSVTASSDLELDPYPVTAAVTSDSPVRAACLLVRGGAPVTGARVTATYAGLITQGAQVQFFDDGKHEDGRANDGVYCGTLGPDLPAGACRFVITATGRTAIGLAFERLAVLEFAVAKAKPIEVPVVTAVVKPAVEPPPPPPAPPVVDTVVDTVVEPEPEPPVPPMPEEPVVVEATKEETAPPYHPTYHPNYRLIAAIVLAVLVLALLAWLLSRSRRKLTRFERCLIASMTFHAVVLLCLIFRPVSQKDQIEESRLTFDINELAVESAFETAEMTPSERGESVISEQETEALVDRKLAEAGAEAEAALQRPEAEAGKALLDPEQVEQAAEMARKESELSKKSAEQIKAEEKLELKEKLAEKAQEEEAERPVDVLSASVSDTEPEPSVPESAPPDLQAAERALAALTQEAEAPALLSPEMDLAKAMESPDVQIEDTLSVDAHSVTAEAQADIPEAGAGLERLEAGSAESSSPGAGGLAAGTAKTSNLNGVRDEQGGGIAVITAGMTKRESGDIDVPVDELEIGAAKNVAKAGGAEGSSENKGVFADRAEAGSQDLRLFSMREADGATNLSPSFATTRSPVAGLGGGGQTALPPSGISKTATAQADSASVDEAITGPKQKLAQAGKNESGQGLLSVARAETAGKSGNSTAASRQPMATAPGAGERSAASVGLIASAEKADATALPASLERTRVAPQSSSESPREELVSIAKVTKRQQAGRGEGKEAALSLGRAETAGKSRSSTVASRQPVVASPGAGDRTTASVGLIASAEKTQGAAPSTLLERTRVAPQTSSESPGEKLAVAKVMKTEKAGQGRGKESALSVGRTEAAVGAQQFAAATSRDVPLPDISSASGSSRSGVPVAAIDNTGFGVAVRGAGLVSAKKTVNVQLADLTAGEGLSTTAKKTGKAGTGDGARDVSVSGAQLSESEHRAGAGSLAAVPRAVSLEATSADIKAPVRADARVPRLSFSTKAGVKGGKTARATISLARHSGDWNCSPTAMMFLCHQLEERTGMAIETSYKMLDLSDPELMKLPFVYMTGHQDFVLTEAEVQNLRKYLEAGGHIWGDDSTDFGDERFDTAFRREMARVFPDKQLARLPADFAGFKTGYDLTRGYKGYAIPPGDKYRLDYLEGIVIGDRVPVVYSRNDYGDGLNINPDTHALMPSLTDLSPGDMQEGAVRMGVNLMMYFLTAEGKSEETEFLSNTSTTLRENAAASVSALPRGEERVIDALDKAEGWTAEAWGDAATFAAADARLQVRFSVGDKHKVAMTRQQPAPMEITASDTLAIDVESKLSAGCRLAIGLTVGGRYYESQPFYIKPGRNTAFFKMGASTFKTEETKWEYRGALGLPITVEKTTVIVYSPAAGEIALQNFRAIRVKK